MDDVLRPRQQDVFLSPGVTAEDVCKVGKVRCPICNVRHALQANSGQDSLTYGFGWEVVKEYRSECIRRLEVEEPCAC